MYEVFMMVVYRRIEHGMYSMGIFVCIVKHVQSCRYSIEMYVCMYSKVCTLWQAQHIVYSVMYIVQCVQFVVNKYMFHCTVHATLCLPTILHCAYETLQTVYQTYCIMYIRLPILHETTVHTLRIALSDYSLHTVLYILNDEYQITPSLLYYIVHAILRSSVQYIIGFTCFCNAIL